MKYFMTLSLVVVALFLCGNDSNASLSTFAYEGTVNESSGGTDFSNFVGQTLRMVYTFDTTTIDNNPSANGDYLGAVKTISITVGGNTYTANSGNIIITNNGVNPDQYIVDTLSLSGPNVGGLPVTRFQLNFSDSTHNAFSTDALPTVQPAPSMFDLGPALWFDFIDPQNDMNRGSITARNNIVSSPVPIPAALWLLGSGLLGLIGVRRFRK
jgi:hypothetical protein